MRFSFTYAALAALTTSAAYAQSIASLVALIPTCAVTCLASAAANAKCGLSDYSCQCGAADTIASDAASCLVTSCSLQDASLASSLTEEICDIEYCRSSTDIITASATASIPASATWTYPNSVTPSVTVSVTPSGPVTPPASSTSSAPPTITSNAGSKLNAGAIVAGAVALAAMAM